MSALAWVDFDEAERQRAQRLMEFFREQESRDELGLGSIRDSIADHLFPGTSTIQTRLRYMLFTPWLFQLLSPKGSTSDRARQWRSLEGQLRDALREGGEYVGIIGRDAGADLKRLPSLVYWSGLEGWGIRRFPGSVDAYLAALPHYCAGAKRSGDDDSLAVAAPHALWHKRLPAAPSDLLEETKFRLSGDEANFLIDRLAQSQAASLISFLARRGDKSDCASIWMHPHLSEFPPDIRALVAHAELFSSTLHGAALLYNLQLSQLRKREDWVAHYQAQFAAWRKGLDVAAIRHWSLDPFWDAVRHDGHRIQEPTRRFVTDWVDLLRKSTGLARNLPAANALVAIREQRLKRSHSRFTNAAVRDRWQGASGTGRLQFRWPQTKSHLLDLATAG